MTRRLGYFIGAALLVLSVVCCADDYSDTVTFQKRRGRPVHRQVLRLCGVPQHRQGRTGRWRCARRDGRVYKQGQYVGDTSMTKAMS